MAFKSPPKIRKLINEKSRSSIQLLFGLHHPKKHKKNIEK
jgi:hypothetical protein